MPGGPALIIPVVWTTWGQETCLHLIHGAWRCNLRAETYTYSDEYRVQDHGGISMQRACWVLSARALFIIFLVSNKPCNCMEVPPRFELGSLDSKSRVLTITPWNPKLSWDSIFVSQNMIAVLQNIKHLFFIFFNQLICSLVTQFFHLGHLRVPWCNG